MLPLYRALRTVGLDPQRVFQIREAEINREDIHIWLNDGTIAFTQSVDGKVTGAFFEGEGEVLVRPPDRMERASLGRFIGAGVLEEKFASAYLRFNDDTAKDLQPYLRPPSDAAAFLTKFDATARSLAQIDAMRLCISFTGRRPSGGERRSAADRLLHARIAGEHYGVFDVYFDTLSPEQIVVGNASSQNQQIYYDLWMSFPMRSLRKTAAFQCSLRRTQRSGVDARCSDRQQVHHQRKAGPISRPDGGRHARRGGETRWARAWCCLNCPATCN